MGYLFSGALSNQQQSNKHALPLAIPIASTDNIIYKNVHAPPDNIRLGKYGAVFMSVSHFHPSLIFAAKEEEKN